MRQPPPTADVSDETGIPREREQAFLKHSPTVE
jgi:hypothetical protein